MSVPICRTVAALRQRVAEWHAAGEDVALVPTMGALHAGHLALVRRGREVARRVVASLFVNPTQFAPHEDFGRYPRNEAGDAAMLADAGCDLLYAPDLSEMYPAGFATAISVAGPALGLCGDARPQMFGGVALVVTKLFLQARPQFAMFGEKDYQQLQVVRRFTRDLDIPVEIIGVPTARDADGLALSSRNAYLTPEQRRQAPELNRALGEAAARLDTGVTAEPILATAADRLRAAGFDPVDYVSLRDAETLRPLDRADRPGRLLGAAWMGRTRLIDNVPVPNIEIGPRGASVLKVSSAPRN